MHAEGIELAEKVTALCRPDTYPQAPARIEVIETHMSFVFLTPQHAYKLKKPVHYPFLDFSTLALRRRYCEEELRLNQRLAPGVYLGVVALGLDSSGRLRIGAGTAVEWLVHMKRLPHSRMLDQRICRHALAEHELVALAARLAKFYLACPPETIAPDEYRRRLAAEIEIDRSALAAHPGALDPRTVAATTAALFDWLREHAKLLDQRVAAGRIVEGHGDLRPEHVCLLGEPVVFDALEFNRSLRIVDPADEIAFLAMECERLGAPQVGPILLRGYASRTGDTPPQPLIDFYKARRASLRARLCIQHLSELDARFGARWVERARGYLATASACAGRLRPVGGG